LRVERKFRRALRDYFYIFELKKFFLWVISGSVAEMRTTEHAEYRLLIRIINVLYLKNTKIFMSGYKS
jgi:hypothetical protein